MALPVRGLIQVLLTTMTLTTACVAVALAYIFGNYIDQMSENFRGALRSTNLPCIRSTMDDCQATKVDKCWDYCCPPGYYCARSPIVGLYCKDGTYECGDHNWCRDFADIPETCPTQTCKDFKMLERVSSWSYVLACIGIFLDLLDIITIFTLPDSVIFKSGVNIFSSLMKWVAFGTVVGAGTSDFLSDLDEARCFNSEGMTMVANAEATYYSYAIAQVLSASLSVVLAPISAYYGGRVTGGVPLVK